ncbi:MAG: hypothetical protein IJS54_05530 [Desulfovibrio sp.]|nr:hypothetical protein [Desulfovibrio sp.]
MTPSYVASALEGRVRLRHPLLANQAMQDTVKGILKQDTRIHSMESGRSSILLSFDPSLTLDMICHTLEQGIPEFAALSQQKTEPKPLSLRKVEVRTLFGLCGMTVLLGFLGSKTAHVVCGTLMTALTAWHIWKRRAAL